MIKEKKHLHSKISIASLTLSIIFIVGILLTTSIVFYTGLTNPGKTPSVFLESVVYYASLLFIGMGVVSFILGLSSLLIEKKKDVLAILGTSFSGVFLLVISMLVFFVGMR